MEQFLFCFVLYIVITIAVCVCGLDSEERNNMLFLLRWATFLLVIHEQHIHKLCIVDLARAPVRLID